MSIVNFIKEFRKKNKILFTTPSHSQGDFVIPESLKLLGRKYFKSDYSECDGFDNLAQPSGIIKSAQEYAAKKYGAKHAFFLVNGSSSGIVAAMLATLNRGDKVLISRNCHKSVYNGLVLTGAVPVWIMPSFNENWGIYETINVSVLEETLSKNEDIKAFIITNPTYEGKMSDIAKISEICKKYNVLLIADEAHGALWNFNKFLGAPAILQGADISVQSLHKTAGAINPSSILLLGSDNVRAEKIQQALNLINTTSPSYPVLMNIENTVKYLGSREGKQKIHELIKNIDETLKVLKSLPNVEIYSENNDITKILVKITNVPGRELAEILYDKYNIECELANEVSVLFLTGIGTTKNKLKKLEKALTKIAKNNIRLYTDNEKPVQKHISSLPRVKYTPALVWNKPSKEIDIKFSVSRTVMEVIADYPPGIPVLLPGEVIKKEHIEYLSDREKIKVLI